MTSSPARGQPLVLSHPEFAHEAVHFHSDPASGLKAIVAIHDRSLGPAIGGCRLHPYRDEEAALTDVLRLSRGMTYKCAISNIPFGGGKAVVIARPEDKSPALLRAFGRFVDSLSGRYITSFDIGTTLDDVREIGKATRFVGGVAPGAGNAAASTAAGVLACLQTAVEWRWPGRALSDVTVAVQGAGNVGARLAKLLGSKGARVLIADLDVQRAADVAQMTGARAVPAADILTADVDVFAPCAMGGILTEKAVGELRARVVVGGANNQLATRGAGLALQRRGIVYAPDYLANAGGIVDLHYQINGGREALAVHLESLGGTLREVLEAAHRSGATPEAVADQVAESRFADSGSKGKDRPNG